MNDISVENSFELARLIAAAWQKVLPKTEVGPNSNFFVLGGDSMLGSMLMLELSEVIHHTLSLGDLYAHPTFNELLVFISRQNGIHQKQANLK